MSLKQTLCLLLFFAPVYAGDFDRQELKDEDYAAIWREVRAHARRNTSEDARMAQALRAVFDHTTQPAHPQQSMRQQPPQPNL